MKMTVRLSRLDLSSPFTSGLKMLKKGFDMDMIIESYRNFHFLGLLRSVKKFAAAGSSSIVKILSQDERSE